MVLIFMNFGGGGRWWVGPLITLLPLLLSSGLLAAPLQLLSLLFGFRTTHTYVYDPQTQLWRRQGYADGSSSGRLGAGSRGAGGAPGGGEEDGMPSGAAGAGMLASFLTGLTSMLVTCALTVLLMRLLYAARREGLRPALRRLLFEGLGGELGGGGGRARQGQGQARVPRSHSERIERVAQLMQSLPVEVYRSKEELERMPVVELKRLLKKRGGACQDCLEKSELVGALLASGNSSAATCSVCFEDYEPGDVMRVLPCSHRFHLECIDRWLLSSTDYSRPSACPICNAELEAVPRSGS